jgi:MFS family permease
VAATSIFCRALAGYYPHCGRTSSRTRIGLAKDSLLLLSTFVIAFGVVKGSKNFLAGHWAEKIGRKPVHLVGWVIALPIPVLFYFDQS